MTLVEEGAALYHNWPSDDPASLDMTRVLQAGAAYFAAVFALGFVLGVLRALLLAPQLGAVAAVATELLVLLPLAWLLCRRILRHWRTPAYVVPRLGMGGVAFALLMAAEFALAGLVLDRPPAAHLASYGTAAGGLGLAGQLVFAAFPVLQALQR